MVPNSLNPIHSILFFILAVCNLSAILLLLKIGFLAFMFFIIYIGAISVLFLFIIMLLNIRILDLKENILNYLPINLTVAFLIAINFMLIFYQELTPIEINNTMKAWSDHLNEITDVETVGLLIYTYYYYFFFVIGLVLLIAMVSSIMLTLSHKKLVRRQNLFIQINKSFEKTIFLVRKVGIQNK